MKRILHLYKILIEHDSDVKRVVFFPENEYSNISWIIVYPEVLRIYIKPNCYYVSNLLLLSEEELFQEYFNELYNYVPIELIYKLQSLYSHYTNQLLTEFGPETIEY